MIFDEAIHPDRMWQLLVERLHRFDRFQCRVQVNSDGSFIFQQVREIDRSYHLVEVNATGWTADHLNQVTETPFACHPRVCARFSHHETTHYHPLSVTGTRSPLVAPEH